jgi:nucleotide-binding universal stress UspA family protein
MRPGQGGPVLVVGFDASETAYRALHYALGMALRQGGEVIAAFAQTLTTSSWHPATELAVVGSLPELTDKMAAEIDEACDTCQVPVRLVVGLGTPISVLTKTAEEHHADLVVVGASNKSLHRVLGSVGVQAVRLRRWPVTVIP